MADLVGLPPKPRAEFPALAQWLEQALSPDQRRHFGLVSLNQWPYFSAILGELALTAQAMGSEVTLGLWADQTPLPDPGWTTSRWLAHVTASRSLDENLQKALSASGIPNSAFAHPPLKHWRAVDVPTVANPVTRADIRRLTYQGSPMGRSILQVHPDTNTPIRDQHVWPQRYTERAITSYAWVYDQVFALVKERGITTLIVYNGRFTHDQAAAAAAQAAGAEILYYDAGGLDTGFDLTFAPTHDWVDLQHRMLHMWEQWPSAEREQIGGNWFRNRQEHKEAGLELFVGLQERGNLRGVPHADRLIAYFSSSPDEIAELDLDWSQHFQSQNNALATLARVIRDIPSAQLVVRTHPHMRLKPRADHDDWRRAVQEAAPAAHFDADDPIDSYALMQAADVVVTYGSTSGVEAASLGRPVLVLGPSAYDILGCAQRISTVEALTEALTHPPEPAAAKALPYGLMMQRRGFNFEYVTSGSGYFSIAGHPVRDARTTALKLSHLRRKRLIASLTRR